ncbi:hypothetical protein [Aneurinibacillus aneurinilyticus]|jgi:hypothetical protein|uniref:Uncharacterized protein n=2 Tax=Aneurinibacillus aneurinilyticus TaxID=1391 RepID=A0A848CWW2_ANEAE|nr:hypothetical protein [Aneurinibacillus aneurinilyticus]ERI08101.1 hypothetical protein HMPREF0083_03830 [Aneurinibacillus aneurinilyticus ATCC 12856]MCI1694404.1 hypothetical protein [Aneurinibacillus aneurinilyticus]MED0670531.1 hypothetical protein [Aneurinibacillus aneurinilyticus]MED0706531.1 hypothetical protein [Aneurinibacillus aneurinilyticus]MED0724404.1 hypothetical protein [Aneurinibacillus aneurinilyticus]
MHQPFDITLTHRLADQLVECATSMKEKAQSPGQVQQHVVRLTSIIDSLHSLAKEAEEAGMNPINDHGDIR